MVAVTPADLGQRHKEGEYIGDWSGPGLTVGAYDSERARLDDTYDALLPSFAAGDAEVPAALRPAARLFSELFFAKFAAPPLLPYYRSVGGSFLAWVESNDR